MAGTRPAQPTVQEPRAPGRLAAWLQIGLL